MRVLDLFSGIGGFSLGLERAGMQTVAFCEIDPYCRRVLARHWPEVPIYDDVRTLTSDALRRDGIAVDLICGGFPCQDISIAGKGAGLAGERSGLWREFARLIGELRPRYVIVENVAALLGRGMDTVLGDLAALGFDAEWHCIPAAAVGAPHRRDRVWIVAYPNGQQLRGDGCASLTCSTGEGEQAPPQQWLRIDLAASGGCPDVANADLCRQSPRFGGGGHVLCDADSTRLEVWQSITRDDVEEFAATIGADWWLTEPDVGRVAHGVPARVDRLRGLGNAVVPQIPELIGRAIMAVH